MPDGYRIPVHWHSVDEHVTVLEGIFMLGIGDRFDETKLQELPPGSFIRLPHGTRHYAKMMGQTIIQVHGSGPLDMQLTP